MSRLRFCFVKKRILNCLGLCLCGLLVFESMIITTSKNKIWRPKNTSRIIHETRYYKDDGRQQQQQQNSSTSSKTTPSTWHSGYRQDAQGLSIPSPGSNKSCGSTEQQARGFVKVTDGIFVYSAYADARLESRVHVRIMALVAQSVMESGATQIMYCVFHNAHSSMPYILSWLTMYKINDNYNAAYGSYILGCSVPLRILTSNNACQTSQEGQQRPFPLCDVTICAKKKQNIACRKIAVEVACPRQRKQYTFGTCIPPLSGNVIPDRIIAFIELTRIFGSEHLFFYLYRSRHEVRPNGNHRLNRVMQYYIARGLVTVALWELPVDHGEVWSHGQDIAIADCLYRNMGQFSYLTFNDVDEYIVPQPPRRAWKDMMMDGGWWPHNVSAYRIHSAFSQHINHHPGWIASLEHLVRTKNLNGVRMKTVVMPERVFELGIHRISKSMDKFAGVLLDSNIAILHHYSKCLKNLNGTRTECNATIEDRNMLRYKDELMLRINQAMNEIQNT